VILVITSIPFTMQRNHRLLELFHAKTRDVQVEFVTKTILANFQFIMQTSPTLTENWYRTSFPFPHRIQIPRPLLISRIQVN
jgi:hypothetical protein